MRIDLRSDTVTKPTPAMLEAMIKAEVGDDVFGEDPSVNELEALVAGMFGKEAAIFCPTGTMANQVAIKCHTNPGEEVICEQSSHVFLYEVGGIAFNSGCQVRPIAGHRGMIKAGQVLEVMNPPDYYKPVSRLVCIENTTNRGGGSCYELSDIQDIRKICQDNNLTLHLDGARIWNAMVAKGEKAIQYGELFDSVSVCLSKGLGSPAGKPLIGDTSLIQKARRIRKVLGGGMRQAGYLAAAGKYALLNNVQRLSQDHKHARDIADVLSKKDFTGNLLPVETNIIIFELKGKYTARSFADHLSKKDILCIPISETYVRMVTHLDITPEMVDRLTEVIANA